jgi:hypothetical protein
MTNDRANAIATFTVELDALRRANPDLPDEEVYELALQKALVYIFQDPTALGKMLQAVKSKLNEVEGFKRLKYIHPAWWLTYIKAQFDPTYKKMAKDFIDSPQFGVGNTISKFPKTPGSFLTKGVYDYSGLASVEIFGIVKNLHDLRKNMAILGIKPEELATSTDPKAIALRKEFAKNMEGSIRRVSTSLIGGAVLTTGGYLLTESGILTGFGDQNRTVDAAKKSVGWKPFSINWSQMARVMSGDPTASQKYQDGDLITDAGWVVPIVMPMLIGAAFHQSNMKRTGERELRKTMGLEYSVTDDLLTVASDLSNSTLQVMSQMPSQKAIQGLTDIDNMDDFWIRVTQKLYGFALGDSFIPSAVRSSRVMTDDIRREIYDPDMYYLKGAMANIRNKFPYLSKQVPVKIGLTGEAEKYQLADKTFNVNGALGMTLRVMDMIFNPAITSRIDMDKTTGEMLKLFEAQQYAYGSNVRISDLPNRTVTLTDDSGATATYRLSADEFTTFATFQGKLWNDRVKYLLSQEWFNSRNDSEKFKLIKQTPIFAAREASSALIEYKKAPKELQKRLIKNPEMFYMQYGKPLVAKGYTKASSIRRALKEKAEEDNRFTREDE